MKRGSLIYIVVFALGIIIMFMFESSLPPKIDWSEKFLTDGTDPYDLKVFNDQLKASGQFDAIKNIDINMYQYIRDSSDVWGSGEQLLMYIGPSFEMDSFSSKKMYEFVAAGNDILISANYFNKQAFARYKKETGNMYLFQDGANSIQLSNGKATLKLSKSNSINYIKNEDTIPFDILGSAYFNSNEQPEPNFIRIKCGKGNLYLHTAPVAFTNYYLLYGNAADYVSGVISFSNKRQLLYYNKPKMDYNTEKVGSDSLKFIFEHIQLRYAWYLALLSLLIFIIFNAKRRQRMVPIVVPLENKTVRFAKTISNLFYETKNHQHIINRRIVYFLEYVRSHYHLDTQYFNIEFVKLLSAKSGVSMRLCEQLVQWIAQQQLATSNTSMDLVTFNKLLEQFKKEEKGTFN